MRVNALTTRLSTLACLLMIQVSTAAWAADGGVTYRITWDADAARYRVFLRASSTPSPDLSLTAQVTLRVPHGTGANQFRITDLQSKPGTSWALGSSVTAPIENPTFDYLSFGFTPIDVKAFAFKAGEEQEAFSFKNSGPCIGTVALIDNATDPFNQPPNNPKNSINTNPNNQFSNAGWGSTDDNDYLGNTGEAASCPMDCATAPPAPEPNSVYYRVNWEQTDQRYHVYMYPGSMPSPNMSLTSQVTLKMPHASGTDSFKVSNITSAVSGITWTESSRINAPKEDTTADYLSFTMNTSNPKGFQWQDGKALEVFSFANSGTCLGEVALMNNASDPFNSIPNSMDTNPGNQFANLGWGGSDANHYAGNYGCPASCTTPPAPVISLQARVVLQGAYDTQTKLMRDTLRTKKLLPSTTPYQASALPQAGNQQMASALLDTTGNDAPVDWVQLTLHDATNPTLRMAEVTGLVQRDGDIMDAQTGSTTFMLDGVTPGKYYVSVHHRNHLDAMSAAPIELGNTPSTVDFSQATTSTYGSHARTVSGGQALLWAGNANADGFLIAQGPTNDGGATLTSVLLAGENSAYTTNYKLSGYQATDTNMDGLSIFAGPSNDVDLLLGNVLLHPVNSTFSANYIVRQQLP